jgi:trimethylamine:corrinoid methyltransferase-like protein
MVNDGIPAMKEMIPLIQGMAPAFGEAAKGVGALVELIQRIKEPLKWLWDISSAPGKMLQGAANVVAQPIFAGGGVGTATRAGSALQSHAESKPGTLAYKQLQEQKKQTVEMKRSGMGR